MFRDTLFKKGVVQFPPLLHFMIFFVVDTASEADWSHVAEGLMVIRSGMVQTGLSVLKMSKPASLAMFYVRSPRDSFSTVVFEKGRSYSPQS